MTTGMSMNMGMRMACGRICMQIRRCSQSQLYNQAVTHNADQLGVSYNKFGHSHTKVTCPGSMLTAARMAAVRYHAPGMHH